MRAGIGHSWCAAARHAAARTPSEPRWSAQSTRPTAVGYSPRYDHVYGPPLPLFPLCSNGRVSRSGLLSTTRHPWGRGVPHHSTACSGAPVLPAGRCTRSTRPGGVQGPPPVVLAGPSGLYFMSLGDFGTRNADTTQVAAVMQRSVRPSGRPVLCASGGPGETNAVVRALWRRAVLSGTGRCTPLGDPTPKAPKWYLVVSNIWVLRHIQMCLNSGV